ncbi:MAG: hybrid sensor histidine kinase/response regulator, partial [Burkholderiales bacterium]|nr:hybrid sensor histidine kinase/response regulator [Burkholderiales bacterium]
MPVAEDVRVVLVDDDADTCETLSALLKLDGYSVRVARTAQDAMAAVDEYRPVCALLD